MTDHPLKPADAIDRRMLWYFYLLPITFVASLLFGIAMFWVPGLSPWNALLSPITDWILNSTTIQNRYRISVDFCGSCGDRYLLTVELFLFFCFLYATLFAIGFGGRCLKPAKNLTARRFSRKEVKVLATCFAISCVLGLMIWSLLFSQSFASPSRRSSSDYSLFNFTLLLQVTILFHIMLLPVWVNLATFAIEIGSIFRRHRN